MTQKTQRRSGPPPVARGQIPGHATDPGDRFFVRGQPRPARTGPTERLLYDVLAPPGDRRSTRRSARRRPRSGRRRSRRSPSSTTTRATGSLRCDQGPYLCRGYLSVAEAFGRAEAGYIRRMGNEMGNTVDPARLSAALVTSRGLGLGQIEAQRFLGELTEEQRASLATDLQGDVETAQALAESRSVPFEDYVRGTGREGRGRRIRHRPSHAVPGRVRRRFQDSRWLSPSPPSRRHRQRPSSRDQAPRHVNDRRPVSPAARGPAGRGSGAPMP